MVQEHCYIRLNGSLHTVPTVESSGDGFGQLGPKFFREPLLIERGHSGRHIFSRARRRFTMNGCSLDKNRNETLGKTERQNDVRN